MPAGAVKELPHGRGHLFKKEIHKKARQAMLALRAKRDKRNAGFLSFKAEVEMGEAAHIRECLKRELEEHRRHVEEAGAETDLP